MKKQDALARIAALAAEHGITAGEINQLIPAIAKAEKPSGSIAMRLFSYLGGIFIFAGISTYMAMFWGDMNSLMRVLITFGTGFSCYVMGIIALRDNRYPKAISPLFLIAALLQPTGLFVAIYEWFNTGSDERYAALLVFGALFVQQLFTFQALLHPMLLFFSLLFGSLFTAVAMDLIGIPDDYIGLTVGLSLLCFAYNISKSVFHRMAGFWYFVGSSVFLYQLFELCQNTLLEPVYIAAVGFMVYLSVLAQSTVLLIVSVIAMLSYIGYFTAQHFVNSVGWPIALIVLGLAFFGIGAGALKIKRKYLQS